MENVFKNLYKYRELLKTSVKKEVRSKYKNSFLGVLPHTLCSNCGYYDGKQIVVKKDNNE